jgi:hypothetical protein
MRALAPLLLSLCLAGCTSVFFQPSSTLFATPGQYGLDYERVEFNAADGTPLFAWFLPARGAPRGTVLFLHGNAENISTHFASVAWMPAAGFNVLAFDYRGYGASQGRPTLSGVQLDIDAAMRVLLGRADVDPQRIVVFGIRRSACTCARSSPTARSPTIASSRRRSSPRRRSPGHSSGCRASPSTTPTRRRRR